MREWRNAFVGFTAGSRGLSPVTQSDLITQRSREDRERGDHLGSRGILTPPTLKVVWVTPRKIIKQFAWKCMCLYFSDFMNYSPTEIALKLRLGLEKGHREVEAMRNWTLFLANVITLKIIQNNIANNIARDKSFAGSARFKSWFRN